MHTGNSKEIVSHAYPGDAYKSYIYGRTVILTGSRYRPVQCSSPFNNLTCAPRRSMKKARGALTLERGMGMCRGHDLLFSGQSPLLSLPIYLTVNAPLLCSLFSIFRKFLHFQPCFSQNFSSLDPNFSKFSFPRPPFFKEKPLPRPYILKPAWHTSTTTKKVELPPPPGKKDAIIYF